MGRTGQQASGIPCIWAPSASSQERAPGAWHASAAHRRVPARSASPALPVFFLQPSSFVLRPWSPSPALSGRLLRAIRMLVANVTHHFLANSRSTYTPCPNPPDRPRPPPDPSLPPEIRPGTLQAPRRPPGRRPSAFVRPPLRPPKAPHTRREGRYKLVQNADTRPHASAPDVRCGTARRRRAAETRSCPRSAARIVPSSVPIQHFSPGAAQRPRHAAFEMCLLSENDTLSSAQTSPFCPASRTGDRTRHPLLTSPPYGQ